MKRKRLISIVLTAIIAANFITVKPKTVQATEKLNLALNKQVTASSYEVEKTSPEKAIDGDIVTRWGTSKDKAAGEWIEVNLEESKEIKQINICFERSDAEQNILGYKVEIENNEKYTEVYRKSERAKQNEKIVFDEMKTASKVKITILDADGGNINWKNVGINEVEIYSDTVKEIESREDINHVRSASMRASSVEENLDRLNATNANDGSKDTRWASNYENPSTQWLKAEFPELTKVEQININFLNRDVSPGDSNVEQFSIKYTDEDGVEKYIKKDFINTSLGSGKGWNTDVSILLDDAIVAKDITVCEFVANSSNYNNVSITELEAYSNEQSEIVSLDSIVAGIVGQTLGQDVEKLPMPSMPEGYTIKLNGADFEQIIGDDGTIVRPLTDKSVKVSFEVTEEKTQETKKTGDLEFIVKGKNTQIASMNKKPVVIPEIAEWYSDSTNTIDINSIDTVVYNDNSLVGIVDEFISDYENFTGIKLSKVKGSARANAYNFIKEIPDSLLGDEGYIMDIQADRIIVKSQSSIGNMYGMQTILQMYKQNESSFNVGIMRDYPRFETRGFLFDVARKPVSMEMIQDVSRTMRYYKMNDLQVHLSDNYIFLEQYGKLENENEAFKAYEAFRLESGLTNDKGESPTATDYSISKEEFNNFITSERNLGMKIVPEIDVPAHATSFTKIWPEIMVANKVSMLNGNRPLVDHIDVSKKEAMDKIKEIFDDYTKGNNPTFDSQTTVHIGADEFLANYTAYRNFLNDLVPYVKETNTVRMWGGLTWIDDKKTQIEKEAIENVEMNLWSSDWADGLQMYDMGYKLINTIDDFGYMVPNGNKERANAYGDLLNINRIFNEFEANRVKTKSGYKYVPSGDKQVLGAAFALWNDNIDKQSVGLSESDLYWRFFDAMPFYAEKTWAATGKEKGSATALSSLANDKGNGPNVNPYYQEEKEGEVYQSYDFENGLEDTSANNRDLVEGTAKVESGALVLDSKGSYVTSPIDKLGNGNQLSFDITLKNASKPGDIIFEADAAYGTHDIRVMENGKLGFTRELHNYYFDYELPVGKTVNVKIVTEQQKTKLYVDDEFVCDANGKYIHNDIVKKENISNATFALPLERIGSKGEAIEAVIDNVNVSEAGGVEDIYHKENWSGKTNTETIYDDTEGKLEYAFDNKSNTIWHSNWQGAADKLNGTNSFYAEIDFGKAYKINQFSFTPRLGNASGYITKADLYIKNKESDEWITITENKTFEANSSQKTFAFDEQEVQYIKFVAKESNDGWVAVSEFDIANKPEQTFTVHVDSTEGGTVSGGKEAKQGEEVTVTATPDNGYTFDGWYRSTGDIVSENYEYKFNVDGNISLKAHFTKEESKVDKEELENLYNANKDRLEEKYTPDSWKIFKTALDNAKIVLDNKDATQEQVNETISNLNDAISKLVDTPEISEVDKSKLKEIIDKAEAIDASKYTKESIDALNEKLKEVKSILIKEEASQEEVDEAVKELQVALDSLELVQDDNNNNGNDDSGNNADPTPDPEKPVDPEEPGDGDNVDKPSGDDNGNDVDKPSNSKPNNQNKPGNNQGANDNIPATGGAVQTGILLAGMISALGGLTMLKRKEK
ncbi:discoidin domain-containing protein [Clostridium sardiniense]|uniref:Discoidin domain-containing protein n=1 Tax=Clostridium sardiniense TaxID=29369 RepID=A0ABS7KUK8_CLOSR|nr:discoidin domain-containing protein [Clostridium sardiniense]MBY0754499.1 discoidin domain-containing protein [Clostridium sardiniense]MDQ0460146.1 hexosaminidase [Clostridium sardiniense]